MARRSRPVKWTDADNVGRGLAFDQALQLGAARQALRDKVDRYALPLHLLPERFTLTELQRSREAVLGHSLDKSAFRRRLKTSHDIVELADEFVRGARRPPASKPAPRGILPHQIEMREALIPCLLVAEIVQPRQAFA